MFSLRNGSLFANALLVAIGAAAGAGVTVLLTPLLSDTEMRSGHRDAVPGGSPERGHALTPAPGGSSGSESKDGAPSLSAAMQELDPQERATMLRQAGAEAAKRDPATALQVMQTISSEQDKLDYLRGIYSVWSDSDPVAALDYARTSLHAGTMRSESIGIAVNKWAARDARAAWMWADENLSGPLKDQALTDVMIGWTRRTPAAAAQWLTSTGYLSQPLIAATAGTWAEQNAPAAAKWASTLTNKDARQTATVAVASEWALQNPQEAAAHYTDAVSQMDGAALAAAIADIWGTTNPAAAADWIRSLPSGPGKDEAAATLATVWAASDIEAATAWSGSLADASVRRQAITHIGTLWGAMEPDKALAWLGSQPQELATEGYAGAYNSWAATDPIGLRQWVDTTPVSSGMDQARLSLADVLASSDINASLALANQLSTTRGRDDAIARYYRAWRKTDDQSAQEWLTTNWSTFSASTQQRLTVEQYRPIVAR
ncbi:MAG: hypothetical protein JNN17_14030 [Verrucomicrobiaceae bacterium]|nr:hypothetical protein [Verrucomicrobiaceae bacterium]